MRLFCIIMLENQNFLYCSFKTESESDETLRRRENFNFWRNLFDFDFKLFVRGFPRVFSAFSCSTTSYNYPIVLSNALGFAHVSRVLLCNFCSLQSNGIKRENCCWSFCSINCTGKKGIQFKAIVAILLLGVRFILTTQRYFGIWKWISWSHDSHHTHESH